MAINLKAIEDQLDSGDWRGCDLDPSEMREIIEEVRKLRRELRRDRTLLLWYWPRLSSLEGGSPGLAIAYARTRQEAQDRIVMGISGSLAHPNLKRLVRAELEATAPIVYGEPWGLALWGETGSHHAERKDFNGGE